MSSSVAPQLSQFASDVAEGLASAGQKTLAPRYFYDELGSVLFEAITLLPEYGLTRADERLLRLHASEIVAATGALCAIAELGSGSGRKTRHILEAVRRSQQLLIYQPIDVSRTALDVCELALSDVSEVKPVCADWIKGLAEIASSRTGERPMLVLFLGSSIGNLERPEIIDFLRRVRAELRPGDFFLLGADLVKDIDRMISAYDDPTGVTAAFNLNLLARMNGELGGDFDLRSFAHEIRWNSTERRIEMHLLACRNQTVYISALDNAYHFRAGETICTELSHKFTPGELDSYGTSSGFTTVAAWADKEWPFIEALWQVSA